MNEKLFPLRKGMENLPDMPMQPVHISSPDPELGQVQPIESGWINASGMLPPTPDPVLAVVRENNGRKVIVRAMYARKHELEICLDEPLDGVDYDEGTDQYYCREGWYENNQHEETHWSVEGEVTHWMQMPQIPEDGPRSYVVIAHRQGKSVLRWLMDSSSDEAAITLALTMVASGYYDDLHIRGVSDSTLFQWKRQTP